MALVYNAKGNAIVYDGADWDKVVKGVAHRGYSVDAPENTLPSFKLARENGFRYVETDVRFTSDDVPVCIHDATIDRTSNGTGNVSSMTLTQLKQLDFGSWKSFAYAGTKIPTFEEFLGLCRKLGLHPYIELKNGGGYTQARVNTLVDMVGAHGMDGKVSWIANSIDNLSLVKTADSKARLGIVCSELTSTQIGYANTLSNGTNKVFFTSSAYDSIVAALCKSAGFELEAWTIDNANTIRNIDPYVTGITSNSLLAGKVLYDSSVAEDTDDYLYKLTDADFTRAAWLQTTAPDYYTAAASMESYVPFDLILQPGKTYSVEWETTHDSTAQIGGKIYKQAALTSVANSQDIAYANQRDLTPWLGHSGSPYIFTLTSEEVCIRMQFRQNGGQAITSDFAIVSVKIKEVQA